MHFKSTLLFFAILFLFILQSCNSDNTTVAPARPNDLREKDTTAPVSYDSTFKVEAESFADIQVLRYQVPGFKDLPLAQKQLAYYLYEAALSGRDIIYDQKSRYGILLRKTLEAAYGSYHGDTTAPDWKKFQQ